MNSVSRELILPPSVIPIARMRQIYKPGDVEKRLDKLPAGNDHATLRATLERMIER